MIPILGALCSAFGTVPQCWDRDRPHSPQWVAVCAQLGNSGEIWLFPMGFLGVQVLVLTAESWASLGVLIWVIISQQTPASQVQPSPLIWWLQLLCKLFVGYLLEKANARMVCFRKKTSLINGTVLLWVTLKVVGAGAQLEPLIIAGEGLTLL